MLLSLFPVSTLTHTHTHTDRLVLSITHSADEQGDELRAQNEAVEGQRSESLLHGPVLAGRLIWVQVGVWYMSVGNHHTHTHTVQVGVWHVCGELLQSVIYKDNWSLL